jgi:hypothetical protein
VRRGRHSVRSWSWFTTIEVALGGYHTGYVRAARERSGGKKDTAWPARKDLAGKKIRRGRREKIWREKRYGVAGAPRKDLAGKKVRRGRARGDPSTSTSTTPQRISQINSTFIHHTMNTYHQHCRRPLQHIRALK